MSVLKDDEKDSEGINYLIDMCMQTLAHCMVSPVLDDKNFSCN